MTGNGSCDAAIAILLIGWTLLAVPLAWQMVLLVTMRRDQELFYALMREWVQRQDYRQTLFPAEQRRAAQEQQGRS